MSGLTLMCVHAHPDDESSSTGGVLRRYADEGVRTVLVTCTDGALGDTPDGLKPEHDEHDKEAVARIRAGELERAASILGVSRLEMLGYPDSGMDGWEHNEADGAFWTTPLAEPAARIAAIIEAERPQVIVTYDANGFYGHPDHIQAHRATHLALEISGHRASLLHTAIPKSAFARFRTVLAEADLEGPGDDEESRGEDPPFGTPDEAIGVIVDVRAAANAKFDALAAHASQLQDSFFVKLGRERFVELFSHEYFVRAVDPLDRTGVDDDLFAGWR